VEEELKNLQRPIIFRFTPVVSVVKSSATIVEVAMEQSALNVLQEITPTMTKYITGKYLYYEV
jgi:hypothetical protein